MEHQAHVECLVIRLVAPFVSFASIKRRAPAA